MTQVVDLAAYDPFDAETLQCPYPWYAAMRAERPVFEVVIHGRPVWMVTTYDACVEVLSDTGLFSSKFHSPGLPPSQELAAKLKALRAEQGALRFVPTLLTADPPEHTRYRKLVARAFTPRNIASLEAPMRDLVRSLLARWPRVGSIEFVRDFALPLPMEIIARALGVPAADMHDFKRWSDDTMAAQGSDIPDEARLAAELGMIELQRYFLQQIERRRAEPHDDLLGELVAATLDPSDALPGERPKLDDLEILSIVHQLLVAGNETTTKALTEMMLLLGQHPDIWHAVQAGEPGVVKGVVEETLRLGTPGLAIWRIATSDTVLGDVPIPAGGRLLLVFGSANRDSEMFEAGDDFQPATANASHLTFGRGVHYCIGASLARMEMSIALEEMAQAIRNFTLAADNDFRYLPSFMLRGLEALRLDIELHDDESTR